MSVTEKVPRLTNLVWFGVQINSAVQDGDHGVTCSQVYQWIASGELFDRLAALSDMDMSPWTKDCPDAECLLATLREVTSITNGREEDWGVREGCGLSLLVACVLEAVQKGRWHQ